MLELMFREVWWKPQSILMCYITIFSILYKQKVSFCSTTWHAKKNTDQLYTVLEEILLGLHHHVARLAWLLSRNIYSGLYSNKFKFEFNSNNQSVWDVFLSYHVDMPHIFPLTEGDSYSKSIFFSKYLSIMYFFSYWQLWDHYSSHKLLPFCFQGFPSTSKFFTVS